MKLINTPTAVNHRFVDGNREVGQKATQFSAEWCNQIQQELWNLIVAIKGSNPDGSSEEEAAAAFNAYFKSGDVKMSPDEIDVAGAKFRRGSNGATLGTLYSLISGIIEATVKIAVGGSEWVPGNNQPSISGLYSLLAGTVDAANVMVDTLNAHTSGGTKIAVGAVLDALGGLTLTNHIWNASASDIVDKMNSLENGQVAVLLNSGSSSDVSFPAAQGSPNPRSFSVPHEAAVLVVKSGGRIYPVGGDYA